MDKNKLSEALKKLKAESKKRNFTQTIDIIFNFKSLDLKKTENHVDFFTNLHHDKGKKVKVCAFVGPELLSQAKEIFDLTISPDDFPKYKDKKATKKLAETYDFFIAQANVMAKVATTFGRILGTRGKMPNPKAGCVVPPKANLRPLYDRLQKLVKVSVKTEPAFKCSVGTEEMDEEALMDNLITLYNAIIHHLPNEKNNIKKVLIKLTMSKPIKVA